MKRDYIHISIRIISLLLLLLIVPSSINLNAQNEKGSFIDIYIYPDGGLYVVDVTICSAPTIIVKELIGQPYFLMITNEKNEPLRYNLTGNKLTVFLHDGNRVIITYETYIGQKEGKLLRYNITSLISNVSIHLPSELILIYIDPLPDEIKRSYDEVILFYYLTTYLTIETYLPEELNEKTSIEINNNDGTTLFILLLSLIIIIIAFVFLLYKNTVRERKIKKYLTEEEQLIIEFIEKRGGKAYLSEIREGLELSTSTSWRKIKKLEKLGLVKVTRTSAGLLVEKK